MIFALKKTNKSLFIIASLNILLLIGFVLFSQLQYEKSGIELRKDELKRLVMVSINSIQKYRDDFNEGLITKEEAMKLIAAQIRQLKYEDETQPNYIFMSSYDGTMLVQPYQPELEGSVQWDLQDPDGIYIIRKLVETAKSGGGWVEYAYYPPDSDVSYDKISFVSGLPELGCYIGTGMYFNDIESAGKEHFRSIHLFFLFITSVILSSAVFVLVPIIRSVEYIAASFLKLDKVPLTASPDIDLSKFREGSDARALVSGFAEITNRLVNRNNELLQKTEEREMLVKEMNHRVKNNLQIMISLFQLQLQQTTEDSVRKTLLETISRLESISIIHNMLYTGGDYSTISADGYLRQLAGYIFHSFGSDESIEIEYEFDETRLAINNAVTLGIITNEILTNSVKYAFPDGRQGKISISLKTDSGRKIFRISDDGVGMSDPDTQPQNPGLGINLIKNLSRQLNGELTMSTDRGTSYSFMW